MTVNEKRRNLRIRRRAASEAKAFRKECRTYTGKEQKKALRIALRQRKQEEKEQLRSANPEAARCIRVYRRAFFLRVNRKPLLIGAGIAAVLLIALLIIL